jgi:hypothetical protein
MEAILALIIPGDAVALAIAEAVIAAQRRNPTALHQALDAASGDRGSSGPSPPTARSA